ncbi:MAG: SAM-dependent methyltransferase [Gammaproteobacteria bacterium]|nr:SAM-dependent methyltransferase [Gammaproteobacteria bacterium]MCP5201694.1 SAM-dependent methyltransferase [Gammaproteobacteria bacterium]
MNGAQSLPDPDRAGLERSAVLVDRIRAAIAATAAGVIGFDTFMAMALYTPGLGYYAAGQAIFGAPGDFVTAPESGELFGRCLARQCAEVLTQGGDAIVEYGAGSGRLAALLIDLLAPDFPALRYHIVEPSAALRVRQRATLEAGAGERLARLSWSEDHPRLGGGGVIIANEVVDAMPARCYTIIDGQPCELGVTWADGAFAWRPRAAAPPPSALAGALAACAEGYRCEHIVGLAAWCAGLRDVFERGVALVADYGYPRHEILHPARSAGTLKCHYRHHVHDDPFFHPGLQDITVAVDFTTLAEAGAGAGWRIAGYLPQAHFLIGCGLERLMAALHSGDAAADYARAQEAKRLLLPGEMGQVVKVLALALDYDAPLAAFAVDERQRLGGFA